MIMKLHEAARSGNVEKLKAHLTPSNVNLHASNGRESTPLHLAAGYNRMKIVNILLQCGADVHAKDKGGFEPLHNACSYGHFGVAELLIKHGADVNASDLWLFTPLHEAAAKGKYDIVRLLLRHGADPYLKNLEEQTALDLATAEDVRCILMNAMATNTTEVSSPKTEIVPKVMNWMNNLDD